jgi:Tfp pilus assembly protein PilF
MNLRRILHLGLIFTVIFAVACASTDSAKRQKEAEAARMLGEAYLRDRKFTQALKELLKAEKLKPNDHYLQNDLGLVYYYKQKYDKAIEHYKKALDLKSDYGPAINNLGNAYAAQQQWDSAIEYYLRATETVLYATPHFPLANLGDVYYEKKDYQRSEAYYLEALDVRPNFVIALRGLARTYIALNRVEEAIVKLEKAVKMAPDQPLLHYDLARAYQSAGDERKARRAYQTVIELAPDSPLADQAHLEIKKLK